MKLKYIQFKEFICDFISLAVYRNVELIGQNEEVDVKILHNIIVYPKVKIYSSM